MSALAFCSSILFLTPTTSATRPHFECLAVVKADNPGAACEIHYRYHQGEPSNVEIEREAANLFRGVIPTGLSVVVYCWRQRASGTEFHARYMLTERGGIGVDAGFSAEGRHQTTDMHLMSFDLSQEKVHSFSRNATDSELVEPVLRITSDGKVERC